MMSDPSDWSLLQTNLPDGADEEQTVRLTQAAVEAGGLGSQLDQRQLTIYLPRDASGATREAALRELDREVAELGWAPLNWTLGKLEDEPWALAWKADFRTTPVGRRLLIRPAWELGEPPPGQWAGRLTLWLQPGMGFGTGRHETTRMALELLEETVRPGDSVLDFGTGSAVLALAAARLGACGVAAIDIDADAIDNATENTEINGLSDRIRLIQADAPGTAPGRFDLIVCNMLPQNALVHLTALVSVLESSQSRLIYSGFPTDQIDEVETAFAVAGLRSLQFHRLGEWAACVASETAP